MPYDKFIYSAVCDLFEEIAKMTIVAGKVSETRTNVVCGMAYRA